MHILFVDGAVTVSAMPACGALRREVKALSLVIYDSIFACHSIFGIHLPRY
jgi:hypothetical protein